MIHPQIHQPIMSVQILIDDVLGMWNLHPDPAIDAIQWQEFQNKMNPKPQ